MKLAWLARGVAIALLAAWALGLATAAVHLAAWDRELVQVLLQIRADRAFRVRMAERREPIPREWYRSKALALLAAGDRLHDDGRWTVFMPGAWPRFDDLRERLAQRIEREFSEIAVDTIRRELDERAGQLSGVARHPATGELLTAGGCAAPALAPSFFQPGARGDELPELRSVLAHLDQIEQLDRAVQALEELQSPGSGDGAEPLRLLVRYALAAEPPERLSHSAARVRQVLRPSERPQHGLRTARLQQAVRCSLARRMALLDARVFERNDLLASEQQLAPHLAAFLRPEAGRPPAQTLERWHAMVALIGEQERLLDAGDSGWLGGASRGLGPAHEAALARVARIGLLGSETVQQLSQQSGRALQRLRGRLATSLGAGLEPALVWREGEGRYVLSPQRLALRDRLAALLQEPYMAMPGDAAFPDAPPGAIRWDLQRLAGALELAQARRRFRAEHLPRFPAGARSGVAQAVDRQFARHVEHAAAQALVTASADVPPDLAAWGAQQQLVARVESLLVQLGARDRAHLLRMLVTGDLVARLGVAEQALARSDFASPRLQDFGWWTGEGSPLLAALGAMDGLTLRHVLAPQVSRLEAAVRQVAPLLAAAGTFAGEPAVQRWQAAAADLERYRGGRGDGSLAALERTLVSLGPELTAANCLDKLAAWPPPVGADPFAQRHRQLRDGLRQRCGQLRSAPRPGQVPEPAAAAAWPFG